LANEQGSPGHRKPGTGDNNKTKDSGNKTGLSERANWGKPGGEEASKEGNPCCREACELWQALSYLCSDNAADDNCRYEQKALENHAL